MNVRVTGLDSSVRHFALDPETPKTPQQQGTPPLSVKKGAIFSERTTPPRAVGLGREELGVHFTQKKMTPRKGINYDTAAGSPLERGSGVAPGI